MSKSSENSKAEETQTAEEKVVKAFLVGFGADCMSPVFAEAVVNDDGTLHLPAMDDTREGLRFVGRDGQESAVFMPTMTTCYPGALVEIKKYVYGLDLVWAPRGLDKNQLTRDHGPKGPVEEALEQYFRSNGVQPSVFLGTRLLDLPFNARP